jgi:aspartate 1-decarboxylase
MLNEKVQIVNLNNGSRIETYVIAGEKGSGVICMNGGAARCAVAGDKILIMAYILMEAKDAHKYVPKIVHLNHDNKITDKKTNGDKNG